MAEYIIQETTLTEIADSIREKTGSADKIPVASFSEQIRGITTGSADCATVTFMNGSAELLSRPVYIGDDCPDPVTQGRIDTPTKESTVDTVYTYNGWATADGGTADSTVLKNISADKTVYSSYTESVRYYTITYYDSDGTTVLKTESLAYGTTPSYTPVHPTAPTTNAFGGWIPNLATVTSDASYTASWVEKKALYQYTWAELDAMPIEECRANFAVGDVGPNSSVLLAFEHDDLADGSGKAKMTFGTFHKMDRSSSINIMWYSGSADWSTCNYRVHAPTYIATDTSRNFVEAYAKSVKKKYIATDGTIKECVDKYFAPSLSELGYTDAPAEGTMYPAFNPVTMSETISWVNTKNTANSRYYGSAVFVRTIQVDGSKPYRVGGSTKPTATDASQKYAPHMTFCI